MLYRLAAPVQRKGSRFQQFVKRVPADLVERLAGKKLYVPLGEETSTVTVPKHGTIRFSLRTDQPSEVRSRQASALAYLETVFKAAKAEEPIPLSRQQCVALSKQLYDSWSADPEVGHRTIAVEIDIETREQHVSSLSDDEEGELLRAVALTLDHDRQDGSEEAIKRLEVRFKGLVDRALAEKGIVETDTGSLHVILKEFARSAAQGLNVYTRKLVEADYSPDPNAGRFPPWQSLGAPQSSVSLVGLPVVWWKEASRSGHSESTKEAYERAFRQLSDFLGHNDAARVSIADVIAFKDHRLGLVSSRTVMDGDLPALKSVFQWAVDNQKLCSNPAKGVKVTANKKQKRRMRDFTTEEASRILSASDATKKTPRESSQRWAAKGLAERLFLDLEATTPRPPKIRMDAASRRLAMVENLVANLAVLTSSTDRRLRLIISRRVIARSRYERPEYPRKAFMSVVDGLEKLGMINQKIGRFGGPRTTLAPTEALLNHLPRLGETPKLHRLPGAETILLSANVGRSKQKVWVEYEDTDETRLMRSQMVSIKGASP